MAGVVRLAMCAVALYTAPIKRLPDQAVWSHDGMVNISDRLDSNVEEAFARRARGVANDALLHLIEKAVTTHSEVVMVILRSLREMPTLSTETEDGA